VGNDDLKRGVISLFHDHIAAGHPGIAKTMQNITQYYWWPDMCDHIIQYIKGCATCQMHKVNTNPTKPPLYPITPTPDALPFQTIALDFITKLPVSKGYNTILTITDHNCSKVSLFIPCKETIDSEGVAKLFAQHVIPHYRTPRKIISDRNT
jgi:Integrase zinc binding domain